VEKTYCIWVHEASRSYLTLYNVTKSQEKYVWPQKQPLRGIHYASAYPGTTDGQQRIQVLRDVGNALVPRRERNERK
jgi:hypothetical protein